MNNKRKIKGIICAICLVCIFGVLLISIKDMREDTSQGNIYETANNINEAATDIDEIEIVDNKTEIDREKYLTEISEADKIANQEIHRGEYPNRADSREVNPEFILDECVLSDYADGVEIEFLTYNELPDISDYMNNDGMIMEGAYDSLSNYYNILNVDGTLNKVIQKVRVRLDNNVYGEETVIEDYEFVAVKLKVKIRNTQNKNNNILFTDLIRTEGLIYLDDGKLYRNTSVYNYDVHVASDGEFIYHNLNPYIDYSNNKYSTTMTLEPLQEVEGEFVFIIGKQDFDNIYLINSPNGGNIENFNAPYVQFLPFSLLKKLPSE